MPSTVDPQQTITNKMMMMMMN